MKHLAILCLASFCLVSFGQSSDVRVVNGRQVDLQPIHDWLGNSGGDTNRPLAHWKFLEITQMLPEHLTGMDKCVVRYEGRSKTVWLQHLPTAIKQHLLERERLAQEIKAEREYINDETVRLRYASANSPSSAASDSPGGRQIRDLNVAGADLKTRREDLGEMESRFAKLSEERTNELAMFTGQNYGGVEVWDCGAK